MFTPALLVFLSALVSLGHGSQFVDRITQCSIKDDVCLKELFQQMMYDVSTLGIPELNIEPLDRVPLKNISLTLLETIALSLTEAEAIGSKSCVFNEYRIDIDKYTATQDLTCDLTIDGFFTITGYSPLSKQIFGTDPLTGVGKIVMKMDKIRTKYDFPIEPFKKEDGEIYFKISSKNIKYSYDMDDATFYTNNIHVGENDISEFTSSYMNSHWRSLLKFFGNSFVDKAIDRFFSYMKKFYEGIPARKYIIEDLSPYVKSH